MTQTQSLPRAGTYTLSPADVVIGCVCKAMFGTLTVRGTFGLIEAQVTVAADPAHSGVRARIDATSWESGHTQRDTDVKSASLLDVRNYPEISFAADGARQDGADWVLDGTVTAHGSTQPCSLRVSGVAGEDDGSVRFRATTRLDRLTFGITKMRLRVGQFADLTIEGTARPKPA